MINRVDRNPTITAHMATYIHVRRHELGLSLEEVATRAGSSKAHIWALERRRSKNPTLWLILALCDALQCSLNSLIGEDVSQPFYTESEMALIDAHRKIFGLLASASKSNLHRHAMVFDGEEGWTMLPDPDGEYVKFEDVATNVSSGTGGRDE